MIPLLHLSVKIVSIHFFMNVDVTIKDRFKESKNTKKQILDWINKSIP